MFILRPSKRLFPWSAALAMLVLAPSAFCAEDEAPPDPSRPCFPGAGYRKAVSSHDLWNGIEAVVTLPTPSYDPERVRPGTDRPLDNSSVYLGGHAGDQEVDCGLNWEIVREPDGTVSSSGKAFRLFWRARTWNSGPARPEYYFYPGDTVKLTCRTTTEPDKLRMDVQLLKRAAEPKQVTAGETGTGKTRRTWAPFDPDAAAAAQAEDWTETRVAAAAADPVTSFSVIFDAPGFGPGKIQEFKRVNGLDQSGNEGRPAQPTNTRITGAVWREVNLFRAGAPEKSVPFTPERFTDMRCPDPEQVMVTKTRGSGERVDLLGIKAAK